ncbi:MAG TPA: hypothetical protein VK524_25295 [Polyangiaceae bacterium]|nr:hypothetical protein [Polyangiaceae bacterium]
MKLPSPPLGVALLALTLALAIAFSSSSGEAADPLSRYPYDPVCAWGRVANGRGLIVRCLTQAEAAELARRPAGAPGVVAPPVPVPEGGVPEASPTWLSADLKSLRVNADIGKLPEAEKKLFSARERFLECLSKHGGLEDQRAEVHVRFLVRARGRAEGVSVAKRSGLSSQAAQCVAEVVDRRAVGVPEEPIVGATAIFQFTAR